VSNAQCVLGAACIAGKCRSGPACTDGLDCAALLPGRQSACVAKAQKWCRNSPSTACSKHDDCPACASNEPACSRLCEPRRLKFYVNAGARNPEMTDLFLDPDEIGLHKGDRRSLTYALSKVDGPYGFAIRRANCCLDAWWPDVGALGTSCANLGCPADLSCNE
jgi:hypothetical protein